MRKLTSFIISLKAASLEKNAPAQNLCMTCGLCCEGTLFKAVPVGPDERLLGLKARGVQINIESKRKSFLLPCTAYENCVCKVYTERPKRCITYQCKLLRKCLNDKITWDEAAEVVHSTQLHKKKLEANLRQVYRFSSGDSLPDIFRRFIGSHGGEADAIAFRKKHAHILVDYVALNKRLDLYFRKKTKKGMRL